MIRVARRGSKGNPCAGRPWGAPWPPSPQRAQRPQRAQIQTLHQGLGGHWVRLEFLRPLAPFRNAAPPGPIARGHWLRFAISWQRRCNLSPTPHGATPPRARSRELGAGRGRRFASPMGSFRNCAPGLRKHPVRGRAGRPPHPWLCPRRAPPSPCTGQGTGRGRRFASPMGSFRNCAPGSRKRPARAGGTPAPPRGPNAVRATFPVHGPGNQPPPTSIRQPPPWEGAGPRSGAGGGPHPDALRSQCRMASIRNAAP
jgi:hypothetical protein